MGKITDARVHKVAGSVSQTDADTMALGNLVYAHRASLHGFVLRRTRDVSVTEDIVQETFAKLLTAQAGQAIHNVAAFSYRIAENLVRDHFRRAARNRNEAVSEEIVCKEPTSEEIVIARQRIAQFQDIIAKMPPLRRDVFLRRRLHGQSHDEIAKALGISVGSVEKHIVRAITWLSERMDHDLGGGGRP